MLKLQDRPIIGRYARALFGAARDAQAVEPVRRDLTGLRDLLASTPDLARALRHPRLGVANKRALLRDVRPDLAPLVERFAALLFEKNRWEALPEIVPIFEALADAAAGVLVVQLSAPAALSSEETAGLRRVFERAHGGPVRLDARVDAGLLGGVALRVGDRVWDNSLKGQLERLRQTLAGTR